MNIFLTSHVWTIPLNKFGVRQHVAALYEEIVKGEDVHVYPKDASSGLLLNVVRHLPALFSGELNIITQGYPIVAGALVSFVRKDPSLIVHTWKVPGYTDARLSARIYDVMLRRAIKKAKAVVVASRPQKRQLKAMGVTCPVFFAPVTVDCQFWKPSPEGMEEILTKFGLTKAGYVLTVGGSDRDEVYAAHVAKRIGLPYVRTTYDVRLAERVKLKLVSENLESISRVLVYPSYVELRALYAGALLVCLPTITKTNPAGLTSLVEAMACGAVVAVPEPIAEGYVEDGINGFVLRGEAKEFADRLISKNSDLLLIKQIARRFAEIELNNINVAQQVRKRLLSERIWS